MKFRTTFLISFFILFFSACTSTYYQVYKADFANSIEKKTNHLVYEDENCKVSYDLWSEGGDVGFIYHNKTDKDIYLNLDQSYFIINGRAHDYFQDRIFTYSTGTGVSSSKSASKSVAVTGLNYLSFLQTNSGAIENKSKVSSSKGYSVSYNEQKEIVIPPGTSKEISEFKVNPAIYRDCDLLLYPNKREVKTKEFTKSNSPFVFSNRIVYQLSKKTEPKAFENTFFVSEITNYPKKEVVGKDYKEFCDDKSALEQEFFRDVSPAKFYIKYDKEDYSMEH